MYHEDDEEFFLEKLIELGIAELSGMTAQGEITYLFDMVKMKDKFPELYAVMMEETEEALMELYGKGLVDVEYDENLEPMFSISEETREILKDYLIHRGEDDGKQ